MANALKPLFSIWFISIASIAAYGQVDSTSNSPISKISTTSQAEKLFKKHPELDGQILFPESSKDTNEVTSRFYSEKPGFTFSTDHYTYKLLAIDSVLSFNVSYIYFDGNKYSKKKIDDLRNEIISKYRNGTPFSDLAKQYNMDGNLTGELDWFHENDMVPEFEAQVKAHKKGDIFIVDVPDKNWYHVVLKTHDDVFIKKATIIRIKINR